MSKILKEAFLIIWILLLLIGPCVGNVYSLTLFGPYPQCSKPDSIVISWKTTQIRSKTRCVGAAAHYLAILARKKAYVHTCFTRSLLRDSRLEGGIIMRWFLTVLKALFTRSGQRFPKMKPFGLSPMGTPRETGMTGRRYCSYPKQ